MNRISNTLEYRRLIIRHIWIYCVSFVLLMLLWIGLLGSLLLSIVSGSDGDVDTFGSFVVVSFVFGGAIFILLPYARDIRAEYLGVQNSRIVSIAKRSRGTGYPGFAYEVNVDTGGYFKTFDEKLCDSLLLGEEYQFVYAEASKLIVMVRPLE